MIKHATTFVFTLFLINFVSAQKPIFNLLEKQENALIVEFTLPSYQLLDHKNINGEMHQKITAKEAVAILKKGFPEVLKFSTNIQMPNKGVSSIDILSTSNVIKSNINLIPSKGNLYRNINPDDIPFEKADVYNQNNVYPGSLAEGNTPYIKETLEVKL